MDGGLTAFEDGASNWSNCFFARAYPELDLNSIHRYPESQLMDALGIPSVVPIRITWRTFDGFNLTMTKKQMRQFVEDIRDDMRPSEVLDLLKSINYTDVETTPVEVTCSR